MLRLILLNAEKCERVSVSMYVCPLISFNTTCRRHVTVAAFSNASEDRPFGGWWLDGVEQETFTRPGLYLARLVVVRDDNNGPERLEQVRCEAAGSSATLVVLLGLWNMCPSQLSMGHTHQCVVDLNMQVGRTQWVSPSVNPMEAFQALQPLADYLTECMEQPPGFLHAAERIPEDNVWGEFGFFGWRECGISLLYGSFA